MLQKALIRSQKINNIFIGNAVDLNTVMPIYKLLEQSGNYSM